MTMADGSTRPIEEIRPGDLVLSSYGSGDMRGARVTDVFSSQRTDGIRIRTRGGREIVSTPEQQHTQPILQALELGKPVLVEKPIGFSLREADQNLAAAVAKHFC